MFKKVLLSAVMLMGVAVFFGGCSDSGKAGAVSTGTEKKAKFDQTDMKSTARELIRATIECDGEAYWNLLAPGFKQEMIEEVGSEKIAKTAFIEGIEESTNSGSDVLDMKKCLESDENLEAFIKESGDGFVQIKGKWYFDPSAGEDEE